MDNRDMDNISPNISLDSPSNNTSNASVASLSSGPVPSTVPSTQCGTAESSMASSSIRPLAQDVVSLMAAGEVIDSLAAVVRELVENALDAGASRISVSLWPERWQIRVADNGMGMERADLQQAAIAHATSKISTRPDLLNVSSLGFRGEALHSIAQLAQLEIRSRLNITQAHVTQDCVTQACAVQGKAAQTRQEQDALVTGYQVIYDASGEPLSVSEIATAPGTLVTVRNLFGSWLARRQVPAISLQVKAVAGLIHQLALCHPHVTWQVEKNDVPWFSLWPGPTAKTLMPQMLRSLHDTDIEELSEDGLYLAIGLPDRCHRRKPDWLRVAINGRPVVVEELSAAVMACFRRTIPRDRYPVCFLHLTLPPTQLDWNRHPAKSEIYVQGLATLCEKITAAAGRLLQIDDLSKSAQTHRATALIKAAEAEGEYSVSRQVDVLGDRPSRQMPVQPLSDALPGAETIPRAMPGALKAIAQVSDMYILAEHEGGICLIEQHIAHERVLFEQLQQRWQMVTVDSPIILKSLNEQQVDRLKEVGVAIAPFGEQLWAIRSIPEPLSGRADCENALIELSLGANLEAALVATACRTAIRNGTTLNLTEMQSLVNQWQLTQKPRTCPHGRPICLTLKESSLAKYFRRSWMIGKSHGI
ncbi:MAG: DNA mismatch repair endonuclease MutL [Phormidesmis sp.]